jgi:hypothetical protein
MKTLTAQTPLQTRLNPPTLGVYFRPTTLAIETGQHVFDTLYHAVALERDDATLITADDRYRRKAENQGRIAALRDWASAP